MGTTPVRLASQRLGTEDGPSWFLAARLGDPNNVRRTDPAMASPPSSPPQIPVTEDPTDAARPDSRASSINFSYPTRARVGSPPVSPVDAQGSIESPARLSSPRALVAQAQRTKSQPSQSMVASSRTHPASSSSDQTLVYDPNSRRMVWQADLRGVQHAVIEASQQRTGSKRRKKTPQRAGLHLAAGTMGRTRIAASNDDQSPPNQAKGVVPSVQQHSPAQVQLSREVQEEEDEPAVKAIISSPRIEARKQRAQEVAKSAEPNTSPLLMPAAISRDATWQAVRRQPSVVREEPEPEETGPELRLNLTLSQAALDAVPTRQKVYTTPSSEPKPDSGLNLTPSQVPAAPKPASSDLRRQTQVSRERSHSNSPARQAHFGPVQENLTVKHSPPPRSISPRKSALKHASPPRGASPSDDASEASGSVNHELPLGRKKSVRVSFDESSKTANGDNAVAQDSNRHRWYSNYSSINKDISPIDDDEIMKPRPALPSFGSVRVKKPRETSPGESERPLVRPKGETPYSSGGSVSPALLPSPPLGASNDHAIGGIFSSDLEDKSKHAENTPRFREPLPPVVTSVEGSGYVSDSSTSSNSEFEQAEDFHSAPALEQQHTVTPALTIESPKQPANGSANTDSASATQPPGHDTEPEARIPLISVSEPTPPPLVGNKTLKHFFDVPGGFPDDESDQSASSARVSATATGLVEATNSSIAATSPVQPVVPPTTEPSSDSESSIYSDAYEDLSDLDGNGFMSLDAVVDTSLRSTPYSNPLSCAALAESSPTQNPAGEGLKLQTEVSTATTAVETPPAETPQDEWERAKAYWRSLTAEKRALLEREAVEDAGVEGDLEEVTHEPKPKKKKSLERRNSERKALALHMAQQMMAQEQKQSSANHERSYQIKPGTKWTDEDVAVPAMRRTMRSEPQHQQPAVSEGPKLRKSMRGTASAPKASEPRTTIQRPISASSAAAASATITHRQATQSPSGHESGIASTRSLTVKRRDSSSSESSFKRIRAKTSAQGAGFRMSMRPTSPPTTQAEAMSPKRFSLRALSPTGSPPKERAESPAFGAHMRRTLRESSTGRKSPTGMRMPTFGKKSGTKASGRKNSAKFSSRFADSSDEDAAGGGAGFRSRFDDSSDDEPIVPMPVKLPTSHSAPNASTLGRSHRHQGSVASTALPEELEESDESREKTANGKAMSPAPPQAEIAVRPSLSLDPSLRRTRSGRGSILPSSKTAPALGSSAAVSSPVGTFPSLVTDDKRHSTASRRSSLMSVLRRKKHDTAGGISRPGPTESPARRDTKLERSVGQLKGIPDEESSPVIEDGDSKFEEQIQTPLSAPLSAPRSPKLQKRIGLIQQESREGDELKRPSTSGNIGTRTLSGSSQQQHSRMTYSTGAPSVDGSVTGTPTKKKRFGSLRRMFKLND